MILDKTIKKLILMKGKTHRLRKNIGLIKKPFAGAKAGQGVPTFRRKSRLQEKMKTVKNYRQFSGLF